MDDSLIYLIIIAVISAAFALLSQRQKKKIAQLSGEKEAIEIEEHRMFEFLHGLGASLQEDSSPPNMHRYIVDGVIQVINADAGALYLLDVASGDLIPVYLRKQLAPVIPLPDVLV
jgi:sigma-B regulation protein RsbU (phosphoserine phosphatase)